MLSERRIHEHIHTVNKAHKPSNERRILKLRTIDHDAWLLCLAALLACHPDNCREAHQYLSDCGLTGVLRMTYSSLSR